MKKNYKLLSIEENGYDIKNRFFPADTTTETTFEKLNLNLLSKLDHLIISFRPIPNVNLTLTIQDSQINKLQLQTLVLPCVPLTSDSINILDLHQLKILDIGYINVTDRTEFARLDEMLFPHRQDSLRNLSISLSEWQPAQLVVKWKNEKNSTKGTVSTTTQFSSVFENCFAKITTLEDEEDEEDMETTISLDPPSDIEKV